MSKAINLLLENGRLHIEDANLRLTHIPQSLIPTSSIKLGILETPLGKVIVHTEKHAQDYSCNCGRFIIFNNGDKRTLSVPCTTCTDGLQLAECETLLGALTIKPGEREHTLREVVAGYGSDIIRFYRGGIEEITFNGGTPTR
jgi:hypothetical protein